MQHFLINKSEHTAGDRRCEECYKGYPIKCKCGGFIHAQFIKETWKSEIELAFLCDGCGDKFEFPGVRRSRQRFRPNYNKSNLEKK